MREYYRVMLGRKSAHAADCFAGGFIGTDFGIHEDLSGRLTNEWRAFNKAMIPVYLGLRPDKSKITAGLACGAIWTVSKGINNGDIVISPDGTGSYRVGEVSGDYYYAGSQILPHRRKIHWSDTVIARAAMSQQLQNSTGSVGTVADITKHAEEIEQFRGTAATLGISADPTIEDPSAFAMEKHLEDFLVRNWSQTGFAKEFAIFEEDGEAVGQQYATDAGPIDILAVSRDKKRLLVIELKRGRASDAVVGQVLRYMGFVKEQLAECDQVVEGAIIALEDDQKLRWAIAPVPSISFYRYKISFSLDKI